MLKVLKHGSRNRILNPVTKQWQEVINVQFVELGNRSVGANTSMSGTSDVLSKEVGVQTGLSLLRIHTHPVLADVIGEFPVDREFPNLFINRKLFSTPQMSQQQIVGARMVEGKPTYFTTLIGNKELPDEDLRLSNEALAKVDPEAFKNASVTATAVESLEQFTAPAANVLNTSRINVAAEA